MSHHVLITYMNETGQFHHYQPVIDWLINHGYSETALRVAEDLRTFASSCYQELLDITWNLADVESGFPLNWIAFTNEGARNGRFRLFDTETKNLTFCKFEFPQNDLPLYQVTPLANPDVFASALDHVAQRFAPQQFRFHLITKAHGNEELAMTSLMSAKIGLTGQQIANLTQERIDQIETVCKQSQSLGDFAGLGDLAGLGEVGLGEVGLGEVGLGEAGLGKVGLGEAGLGKVGLGEIGLGDIRLGCILPETADGMGVSKQAYLDELSKPRGKQSLSLETVVVESCQSMLEENMTDSIPGNVKQIFTAQNDLPYRSIDYAQVVESIDILEVKLPEILGPHFRRQGNV